MSAERKTPKDINEMREMAREWLIDRPTIKHTPLTLLSLAMGEKEELERAISEGGTEEEINLELGDVLFSVLSMDDRSGPAKKIVVGTGSTNQVINISNTLNLMDSNSHATFTYNTTGPKLTAFGYTQIDLIYSLVFEMCNQRQIDPGKLFNIVHDKNSINYPWPFFNEMTPFWNPKDAMSSLRIIRKAHENNPQKLDQTWANMDDEICAATPCFFDGWVATKTLRDFVKKTLDSISESGGVDSQTQKEIKRLKRVGEWGYSPFIIPGNHNWHLH